MNTTENFPKLFVTDLDDTALGGGYLPYARFPDPFSEFLDKLHGKGCRWSVNTTWGLDGIWKLIQDSAVKSRPAYIMGERGHRLAKIIDEKVVRLEPYSRNIEKEVVDVRMKYIFPIMEDLCSRFRHENINFFGHVFVFKVVAEESDEFLNYVAEYKKTNTELKMTSGKDKDTGIASFVIMPKGLSKDRSLREVARDMNLASKDIVVAGDAMMDVDMMDPEIALYALCPGSSRDDVKNHVREMNGEVGDDIAGRGIIQAFYKLAEKNSWDF